MRTKSHSEILLAAASLLFFVWPLVACGSEDENGGEEPNGALNGENGENGGNGEAPDISCGPADAPAGPPCCNASGEMRGTAECDEGEWRCAEGALCECNGEPITFICSDFCGSGAFSTAACEPDGWDCRGLVRSDSCPADTCWGHPGECCINPSCEDNAWVCERIGVEGVDC